MSALAMHDIGIAAAVQDAAADRFADNIHAVRVAAQRLLQSEPTATSGSLRELDIVDTAGCSYLLGDDEQWRFVWSVIAHAFDPRCAAHLGAAFGTQARLGLSIAQHALLWNLSDDATARVLGVLAADHPLRTLGMLLPQEDSLPGVSTPWRAPVRLWNHLRGVHELDPLVATYGGVRDGSADHDAGITSIAQGVVQDRIAGWIAADSNRCDGPQTAIILTGASGGGRTQALARAVAPQPVVFADFRRVPTRLANEVIVAVQREAMLRDGVPVLANLDALWGNLEQTPDQRLSIAATIAHTRGPLVITTSSLGIELSIAGRITVRQDWPLPDGDTRQALWQAVLGRDGELALTEPELAQVASRYAFGAGAIAASARSAHRHAGAAGRTTPAFEDVVAGVRDNIAERLGEVARRVEVTQSWDELVLSPDTQDDVTALINRVKFAHEVLDTWGFRTKLARGTGAAALFSGPPGTGKTMVAGLIARELKLELYQIDLSKIVSKWVGETEKQLARVFEAAEAGHALLLFDEADALFAKRSAEVKSAVDRYANLEVNYLLQRVESFGGVVILTTNLDASIDPALRRRLAAHITFGTPELEERRKLWRYLLTTHAPFEPDLRIDDLANEYEDMTGANIRNAVLAAAFLAAGEHRAIGRDHLQRGARGEYRAMGRVLSRRGGLHG